MSDILGKPHQQRWLFFSVIATMQLNRAKSFFLHTPFLPTLHVWYPRIWTLSTPLENPGPVLAPPSLNSISASPLPRSADNLCTQLFHTQCSAAFSYSPSPLSIQVPPGAGATPPWSPLRSFSLPYKPRLYSRLKSF